MERKYVNYAIKNSYLSHTFSCLELTSMCPLYPQITDLGWLDWNPVCPFYVLWFISVHHGYKEWLFGFFFNLRNSSYQSGCSPLTSLMTKRLPLAEPLRCLFLVFTQICVHDNPRRFLYLKYKDWHQQSLQKHGLPSFWCVIWTEALVSACFNILCCCISMAD